MWSNNHREESIEATVCYGGGDVRSLVETVGVSAARAPASVSCRGKVKYWRTTVVLPEVNGLEPAQLLSRGCIYSSRSRRRKDEKREADKDGWTITEM